MDKGWRELESDPGLFTLLVEDIGVEGVQVEEIYDLTKPIEGTVYGYVFLFKWIEERRARRKLQQEEDHFVMDEETVNSMFFAQQVITNSCATHALLSILMNCSQVKLGQVLSKLKEFSSKMNPEDKGHAIGNVPELAKAHNSHARPEAPRKLEKQQQVLSTTARTMEAFHFVSYVPINNRLYELDGLKPCPIDHGPLEPGEEWTDRFHKVITKRIGVTAGEEPCHDIRYNLMALVPDRRLHYDTKLNTLKTNRRIVLEALQQMVKVTSPDVGLGMSRTKEPIMTRSVAREAREALANHHAEEKKKKRGSSADEDTPNMSQNILNCHSYAKSPMMDEGTDITAMDCDEEYRPDKVGSLLNESQTQDDSSSEIKLPTDGQEGLSGDFTYPLTIDTKFPPGSPGRDSESTDTASEVCSLLNSPDSSTTSANSSPSSSFLKQLASKAELQVAPDKLEIGQEALMRVKAQLEGTSAGSLLAGLGFEDLTDMKDDKSPKGSKTKFSSNQGFTPKDLLALLKNVEQEIAVTEQLLRDEREKRRKYRIDDCRRTHNYDQFFCTFLSMLAEQGLLSDLMEKSIYKKKARTSDVKMKSLQKIKQNQKKRPRGKKKR